MQTAVEVRKKQSLYNFSGTLVTGNSYKEEAIAIAVKKFRSGIPNYGGMNLFYLSEGIKKKKSIDFYCGSD